MWLWSFYAIFYFPVKMPTMMADLVSLIDEEIPDGRQSLRDSYANLHKVAEYCQANYFGVILSFFK